MPVRQEKLLCNGQPPKDADDANSCGNFPSILGTASLLVQIVCTARIAKVKKLFLDFVIPCIMVIGMRWITQNLFTSVSSSWSMGKGQSVMPISSIMSTSEFESHSWTKNRRVSISSWTGPTIGQASGFRNGSRNSRR